MIRLLADEDLDNDILRGLRRRLPALDKPRGQDLFPGRRDADVLDWCAREGRVLVSQDIQTMPKHAYARIDAGLPMPGVVLVPRSLPIATAIEELALIAELSIEQDWENRVAYLPLP